MYRPQSAGLTKISNPARGTITGSRAACAAIQAVYCFTGIFTAWNVNDTWKNPGNNDKKESQTAYGIHRISIWYDNFWFANVRTQINTRTIILLK